MARPTQTRAPLSQVRKDRDEISLLNDFTIHQRTRESQRVFAGGDFGGRAKDSVGAPGSATRLPVGRRHAWGMRCAACLLCVIGDPPSGRAQAGSDRFSWTLSESGPTSAGIYDSQNRLVRVLWTKKMLAAGNYTSNWDGLDHNGSSSPCGGLHLEGSGKPFHL